MPDSALRNRTPLDLLRGAGVSVWLDALSRSMLESGELETLVDRCGVTGVTSNPATFRAAIVGSQDYDASIRAVAEHRTDPREMFLALALVDVQRAADLLTPTFSMTGGRDGLVSFECSPGVADDGQATVDEALDLWARIDRPNAMIKVPATEAGLEAIERLTARGINVNVTLLFSLSRYERVIDAYLHGLERRLEAGAPLTGVTSVASVFVSRIDAHVEADLEGSDLRGRVGVANARAAYELYRQRFSAPRWRRLADEGAQPQRPLWASTATKDPRLPDTYYLDELATPGAVITVPPSTLAAFADHGRPRAPGMPPAAADEVLRQLAAAGVDLEQVGTALEREGVAAFAIAYDEVLAEIARGADGLR